MLSKYLEARKPPAEKNEIQNKQREILLQLDTKSKINPDTLGLLKKSTFYASHCNTTHLQTAKNYKFIIKNAKKNWIVF
jgi:hypothetical protein